MAFRFSVFLLLAGVGLSACTIPEQLETVEREQRRLRTDSGVLREDLDNARSSLADTRANFTQLQGELSALKGRVDEVERQTDRQIGESAQESSRRVQELASQLARLENELKTQGAALQAREEELRSLREAVSGKQSGKEAATSSTVAESEEVKKGYEEAFRLVEQKDYRGSIARFGEFLKKYPNSDYADNAHYWIGESHYALREFDQAILEFDIVRRKYPKGDKVPAALLKMGFAFAELGDKVDTRLILQELLDRYPQSEEAAKAKQKLKTL